MAGDLVRVTTDEVSQEKALQYWTEHVGEFHQGIRCEFRPTAERFSANMECSDFGCGKLAHFWAVDSHLAQRHPQHIAKDGIDGFYVSFFRKGSGRISGSNRELEWREGSVFCATVGEPYCIEVSDNVDFTTIFFDINWIRSMVPVPENLLLRELTTTSGWGKALASVMQELSPRNVNQLALPPGAVAEHIAGMLALAAGPALDLRRSSRRSLLERLQRDLRDRLHDPTLEPSGFARDHAISLRTLQGAFAASGSSFMAELISLRLDRARSLLEDPRFDGKTIAEIAALVGFVNADHFTARFRKAFGTPPSTYRSLRPQGQTSVHYLQLVQHGR